MKGLQARLTHLRLLPLRSLIYHLGINLLPPRGLYILWLKITLIHLISGYPNTFSPLTGLLTPLTKVVLQVIWHA